MKWRNRSSLRKIIGMVSWIYIAPFFILVYLQDHHRVSRAAAHLPLTLVVMLALLASFASSDLLVEIVRNLQTKWQAWTDRRHFLFVWALFIPLAVCQVTFFIMLREFGMRLGQP